MISDISYSVIFFPGCVYLQIIDQAAVWSSIIIIRVNTQQRKNYACADAVESVVYVIATRAPQYPLLTIFNCQSLCAQNEGKVSSADMEGFL